MLSWNLVLFDEVVKLMQDAFGTFHRVVYRVQPQESIPTSISKTFHSRSHDTVWIVCGMVWLKTRRECSRHTNRCIGMFGNDNLIGSYNQVQVGHQLSNRCYHFRSQPTRQPLNVHVLSLVIQDPFTQFFYCPVLNLFVSTKIDVVDDNPCYLIFFIRHYRIIEQIRQF